MSFLAVKKRKRESEVGGGRFRPSTIIHSFSVSPLSPSSRSRSRSFARAHFFLDGEGERKVMELRACSALQRLVLLIALAVAVQCSSSPTRRAAPSTTASTQMTPAPLLSSRNSAPFVSGTTFTISSPEAFVTPEQQAALEDSLPACVGLASGDDDEVAATTKTTIKTSSTTSAACG